MNIQWYPGHMVKAKRLVKEHLKLVDVVIELVDARVPLSSRNPDIDKIVENKPRIVVLNKGDLADKARTAEWSKYFKELGYQAVVVNSINGQGIKQVIKAAQELVKEKFKAYEAKGRRPRAIRGMIIGIPNVGKSSFINKLAGKGTAKTGDKPGVTKGKQWVKIGNEFELLDTPGILWPKFEDQNVGLKLAFTGAISDAIMDIETLAIKLIDFLKYDYPDKVMARYKVVLQSVEESEDILRKIATKRGCLLGGGRVDMLKISTILLDEFRSGKIGLITLDKVNENIDENTSNENCLEQKNIGQNSILNNSDDV